MSKAILELARGLVRPIFLVSVTAAEIGLLVIYAVTANKEAFEAAKFLAVFGASGIAWWWKERADRHDKGDGA